MAGRALELEGPDDAVRGRRAVVDAAERVLVAVGVPVDEAPHAAVAGLVPVDGRGQPARAEPLHEQLRIGVGAEEELARRVELPGDHDLRHSGFGGDPRLAHGAFLAG